MDLQKVLALPDKRLTSNGNYLRTLFKRKADEWEQLSRRHVLRLFHLAAKRVPAYKDFLKKYNVSADKISTWNDFLHVPAVTKSNYLLKYSLEQLCWDGILVKPATFAATSGSTGMPFYFPRDEMLDWQSSVLHELFLQTSGLDRTKPTLVVVGFGMGVWIGGLITYQAMRKTSLRGYPLSILTPGVNKKEIFEAIKNLGKYYPQIVLCGYPPFIKDVVDEGGKEGISWKSSKVKIVFAAEAFSEKFREHVMRVTGITDPYRDIMNIYGTADLGTMAMETPVSILIRRLALAEPALYEEFFRQAHKLPTLAQFNPLFTNFEAVDGQLLVTAYNALPLIRYAIGDYGGVYSYNEAKDLLASHDVSLTKAIERTHIADTITRLPFVYVYERVDFSTKLYGAIIYSEHIREALHDRSISPSVTGKFTMLTKTDKKHNQYLEINMELRGGKRTTRELVIDIKSAVLKSLLKNNAEYRNNYNAMGDRVLPKFIFWPYEHPAYFKPGIKQKWVKK